jgi:hypothetical protein
MNRDLWNRFMIMLMGAMIIFGAQEIWRSPEPLGEFRYMLSIGLAVLVIVLKLREMRQTERKPGSRV